MKAFSVTDIGERRKTNQDYVYCRETPIGNLENLFIVADGMGGHNAGDYASKLCVEFFTQQIKESKLKSPIPMIDAALEATNNKLRNLAQTKTEFKGMGTTFVAATIIEKVMYVANVGDSRLYVIGDEITQITEDHSLVEAMVKKGEIDRDSAKVHPNKNIITRAIGVNKTVKPDFFEVNLKEGDTVLICSDGLTNMLSDEEIKNIIKENDDLKVASDSLVQHANDNGGKDNIAVIIIKI